LELVVGANKLLKLVSLVTFWKNNHVIPVTDIKGASSERKVIVPDGAYQGGLPKVITQQLSRTALDHLTAQNRFS
jgi:hypothetical protein